MGKAAVAEGLHDLLGHIENPAEQECLQQTPSPLSVFPLPASPQRQHEAAPDGRDEPPADAPIGIAEIRHEHRAAELDSAPSSAPEQPLRPGHDAGVARSGGASQRPEELQPAPRQRPEGRFLGAEDIDLVTAFDGPVAPGDLHTIRFQIEPVPARSGRRIRTAPAGQTHSSPVQGIRLLRAGAIDPEKGLRGSTGRQPLRRCPAEESGEGTCGQGEALPLSGRERGDGQQEKQRSEAGEKGLSREPVVLRDDQAEQQWRQEGDRGSQELPFSGRRSGGGCVGRSHAEERVSPGTSRSEPRGRPASCCREKWSQQVFSRWRSLSASALLVPQS